MKLKIKQIGEGNHPGEVVVSLDTTTGTERLVVHHRSLSGDSLDIGWPVDREDSNLLVELPRETINGSWRVWVPQGLVVE
ncbi:MULTISPECIES: hypothetical protein [unclassified Mesorhizobium]|uniref:hypothetical protein n=1 Tax=unclassified Mesorhizobium TaxID=325217 RepID=UPI00333A90A6